MNLTNESGEILPSVSIVVPAFNNENTIRETIESLKKTSYPLDKLEIIVVDDASNDKTNEVAQSCGGKVVQREKRGGCAAAKNTGVSYAKNEIIAFVDADVVVTENWLRELVKPFKDPAVGAVGGVIKNRFQRTNALEKYIVYDADFRKRNEVTKSVPGSNSAYRREVFETVGRLDPYLGEDPDFSYRVSSHGYKIVYNTKALLYHPYPNKVISYLKKQVYYAWQRTLIFLMRAPCRSMVIKDEHTPASILFQPLVSAGIIVSSLLILIINEFGFVSLFLFGALIALNLPLLYLIYHNEKKLIFFALFLSVLRSFAYTAGMVHGIVSFFKVNFVNKLGQH